MSELQDLMQEIAEGWKFDEESYVGFDNMSESQQKNFIRKHVLLHLMKSQGKIATILEKADHDGGFEELDDTFLAKLLMNVLRLAEIEGLSADNLASKIKEIMN